MVNFEWHWLCKVLYRHINAKISISRNTHTANVKNVPIRFSISVINIHKCFSQFDILFYTNISLIRKIEHLIIIIFLPNHQRKCYILVPHILARAATSHNECKRKEAGGRVLYSNARKMPHRF